MQAAKKKKNYHKGNVREDLISAAAAVLRDQGLTELSLRRVARDVGVAPSAVYNHFENREALLAAVAADGYRQLVVIEKRAYLSATAPECVVKRLAQEYLRFAADNPALYRLMFSAEMVPYRKDTELGEAGDSSFGLSVNWWCGEGAYDASQSATHYPLPLAMWSYLHGVVMLMIDGLVTIDDADHAAVEALCDSLITIFLDGARPSLPKKT